jgi:hypothetical protein
MAKPLSSRQQCNPDTFDTLRLSYTIEMMNHRVPGLHFLFLLLVLLFLFASCAEQKHASIQRVGAELREILSMPTYEHVYHDIVYIGEEASFLFIKTVDTKLLFSIDVLVQAGFDLQKGLELSPGRDGSITVALPPAEILRIDADEESIHQYFAKERGKRISRLDYYDEIDRQKEKIRQDALERNILGKAYENGKQIIEKYLQVAGFEEVKFRELSSRGGGEPVVPEQAEEDTSDGSS